MQNIRVLFKDRLLGFEFGADIYYYYYCNYRLENCIVPAENRINLKLVGKTIMFLHQKHILQKINRFLKFVVYRKRN